jgi:Ribbon-helix-helix protein, copG family
MPICDGDKSIISGPLDFGVLSVMATALVYVIWQTNDARRSTLMDKGSVVTLKLNQQQLELIDRTVARGVAPDRAALVRLALREYAAAHGSAAAEEAKR